MNEQEKKETRTERIYMRATPEEKKMLLNLAAGLGVSLTAFIMGECLGDKIGQMVIDGFKNRDAR